jgi:hypothetical protein
MPFKTFPLSNTNAARRWLEKHGGWLLTDGDRIVATDDAGIVRDLRGDQYIADCEAKQNWDETK